jgi:hypothetical protein
MQNRMENQAYSHGFAGFGYSRRLVRRWLIGSIVRPRLTGLMALIHGGAGGFNQSTW